MHEPADESEQSKAAHKTTSQDERFQRFYNTYNTFSNLLSNLSAPLAFAGLPLDPPAAVAEKANDPKSLEKSVAEQNLTGIFSKAALRATRDDNGGRLGGAESFYVVPTTGGTISYAGILSRAEQEAKMAAEEESRRKSLAEADDADDAEFVDAREMPVTPRSPETSFASKIKAGASNLAQRQRTAAKNHEELIMENQALKHLSDNLARRLHIFEMNSQSSSMALHQSLRQLRDHSPSASQAIPPVPPIPSALSARGPSNLSTTSTVDEPTFKAQEQRIRDLEEEMTLMRADLAKVGRENEKLKTVVGKYRERWEKLKEGARTRRVSTIGTGTSSNPASTAGDARDEKGDSASDRGIME
jgi:hypothetical protein